MSDKVRIATTWLDGCSGCHMSLLDLDERILELAGKVELVYGPLVDAKELPEHLAAALIEGAVGNEKQRQELCLIRERAGLLISFGDCAVTANVPAMRNQFKIDDVLMRGYVETASMRAGIPSIEIPRLLPHCRPLHEFVKVDVFVPGCPPPADTIYFVVTELLEGRVPDLTGKTRFGA